MLHTLCAPLLNASYCLMANIENQSKHSKPVIHIPNHLRFLGFTLGLLWFSVIHSQCLELPTLFSVLIPRKSISKASYELNLVNQNYSMELFSILCLRLGLLEIDFHLHYKLSMCSFQTRLTFLCALFSSHHWDVDVKQSHIFNEEGKLAMPMGNKHNVATKIS